MNPELRDLIDQYRMSPAYPDLISGMRQFFGSALLAIAIVLIGVAVSYAGPPVRVPFALCWLSALVGWVRTALTSRRYRQETAHLTSHDHDIDWHLKMRIIKDLLTYRTPRQPGPAGMLE